MRLSIDAITSIEHHDHTLPQNQVSYDNSSITFSLR